MAINQGTLVSFINLIIKQPKSPIKGYLPETQEVYFNKQRF